MHLNTSKTKEMVIYFGKQYSKSELVYTRIADSNIERVETFKLLGVIFSSDLTWKAHVE